MNDIENTPEVIEKPAKPRFRWYCLTPDRFIFGFLLIEVVLLLSEQFSWFAFNERKGMALLIAVGVLGMAILFLLLWFTVALLFRRRFQYGIRSLLLLTVVVAFLCSWFTVKMQQAKRQKETIEAIERLGGSVSYIYWDDGAGNVVQPVSVGPVWLRNLLGHEFFDDVCIVDLKESKDADAIMMLLTDLPQVRNLVIGSPQTNDTGMAKIDALSNLTWLAVANCGVGDDGIAHLKGMRHLKWLCLNNIGLSDDGLKHLEELDQLEYLNLGMTHTTDAGLNYLKGFSHLRNLILNNTEITDAGLECLQQLKMLEDLFLAQTQITDAGLEHLKKMKQLQHVGLPRQITDAGMASIQQALPKCKISR